MADVISTVHLDRLPEPARLFELCRSIALLEWMLCPGAQGKAVERGDGVGEVVIEPDGAFCFRYAVDAPASTALFTLDNHFGDDMHVWFGPAGTVVWGFAHESEANGWRIDLQEGNPPPGLRFDLLAGLPVELWAAFDAAGYPIEYLTFCIWRTKDDDRWRMADITCPDGWGGERPDGSAWLLQGFNGPTTYHDEVQELYFENEDEEVGVWGQGGTISMRAVERLYAGEPLTRELVWELFEAADVDRAIEAAEAIGYPVGQRNHNGHNGSARGGERN